MMGVKVNSAKLTKDRYNLTEMSHRPNPTINNNNTIMHVKVSQEMKALFPAALGIFLVLKSTVLTFANYKIIMSHPSGSLSIIGNSIKWFRIKGLQNQNKIPYSVFEKYSS